MNSEKDSDLKLLTSKFSNLVVQKGLDPDKIDYEKFIKFLYDNSLL